MKAYDANTEMQVIRTVCDSPEKASFLAKLNAEYFGSDVAIEIYTRISSLLAAGKPIPSSEVLRNDESLTEQSRVAISNPNYKHLSKDDFDASFEILNKYRKGRLILGSITGAIEVLKEDDPDIDLVKESMEVALEKCNSGQTKTEMVHYSKETAEQLREETRRDLESPDDDFISTGFAEFDRKTGGFRRKDVVCLASVPGGGKTTLALQMAINQYMMGYNVCIVSYEMGETELRYRILANQTKLDHTVINLKRLTKKHIDLIDKKFGEFLNSSPSNNRFTIWCPTRELNVPEISAEIKPYCYDIVYIDYLSLLKKNNKKAEWENLGDHTRAAKLCGNSLNAAMVLLAQYDDKENKIKYSKAIVANANFVWAWAHSDKEKESGVIDVKQLKARNAPTYDFYLAKDFITMTFGDYSGPPDPLVNDKDKEEKTTEIPKMSELQ